MKQHATSPPKGSASQRSAEEVNITWSSSSKTQSDGQSATPGG